jgi:carbonic anhydrase
MIDKFLHGHKEFLSRYCRTERPYLERLAQRAQSPGALYVGCSDSRVVPELLTQSAPGELFVVRNVANLVPPLVHADASVGAALEYAVVHLQVPNIIVCGHYGCGGVRAALGGLQGLGPDEASLKEWLEPVTPLAAQARQAGLSPDEELRWAVEENVLVQLDNLLTFPALKRRLDEGRLALHGWIYDMGQVSLTVYDASLDRFVPAVSLAP